MQSSSIQTAPNVEVNSLDLQRALSDECQEILGMTLEAAKKIWAYDPQLLIGRSRTSIPLEKKNFINRLKDLNVFPCNAAVEKLSPASCQLIVSWFPMDQLFHYDNKFNVPRFMESQRQFRLIAVALRDFNQAHPEKDWEALKSHFTELQVFATLGLDEAKKKNFYALLEKLYAEIDQPVQQDVKAQLADCFKHRIFTLNNALIALQNPEVILQSIETHQKRPTHASVVERMKRDIVSAGQNLVIESIRLHFHQIEELAQQQPTHKEFLDGLNALANGLIPLIRRSIACSQIGEKGLNIDDRYMQYVFAPDCSNPIAPLSCTLMEEFLTYLGYDAKIHCCLNIDPRHGASFGHAVIVVINPFTGQKVLVDPTYKQFLSGLCYEDIDQELGGTSILVCSEEDLEAFFQKVLIQRKYVKSKITHSTGENIPLEHISMSLIQLSDSDFLKYIRNIWGLENYTPFIRNELKQTMLSEASTAENQSFIVVRRLLGQMNLLTTFCVYHPEKIMENVLNQFTPFQTAGKLPENKALELCEALQEVPFDSHPHFRNLLNLDTRPINRGLLSVKAVGYNMALRELINPANDGSKVALYACSGADLSTALLALNVRRLILVDQTAINIPLLQQMLLIDDAAHTLAGHCKDYITTKSILGGGMSSKVGMPGIEARLLFELIAMGVDLKKVKVAPNPQAKGANLFFEWSYHEQGPKNYMVTYIQADIQGPSSYPPALKDTLTDGIDYYFEKSAMTVPENYPQFLPKIAGAIKLGGYLMTNGYHYHGRRYPCESLINKGSKQFSLPETTPKLSAYRQLCQTAPMFMGWKGDVVGLKLEDRYVPPLDEYWLFVDPRKRVV